MIDIFLGKKLETTARKKGGDSNHLRVSQENKKVFKEEGGILNEIKRH